MCRAITIWGTTTCKRRSLTYWRRASVPSAGGGMELRIRKATTPEPILQQLYRQLGIPTEIMRPQRSLAPAKAVPKS